MAASEIQKKRLRNAFHLVGPESAQDAHPRGAGALLISKPPHSSFRDSYTAEELSFWGLPPRKAGAEEAQIR
jgi:hypothetical protein